MPPIPPVTRALLLVNVAVFFLLPLLGPGIESYFALWPIGPNFMPWQVISYAFLHGSFEHLFFNMLGLWMFGSELERVWGDKRFLQFYTASVLAAAVTSPEVTILTRPAPRLFVIAPSAVRLTAPERVLTTPIAIPPPTTIGAIWRKSTMVFAGFECFMKSAHGAVR